MIWVKGLETYFGGKGGSGTYQTIINHIPPHQIYIEPFLGSGAIMRHKLPATLLNRGIDLDPKVGYLWNQAVKEKQLTTFEITCGDGIEFLRQLKAYNIFYPSWTKIFIYLDPPYLVETRSDPRERYLFELNRSGHEDLLNVIYSMDCFMIAISCYQNDLYQEHLKNWNCIQFKSQTRRGPATETLYMNYPPPETLHDYRYLGVNFRERERIRNKIKRHTNRLQNLPVLERNAILNAFRSNNLF